MKKQAVQTHTLYAGGELHLVPADVPELTGFIVTIPYSTILESAQEVAVMQLIAKLCADDTKLHTKQESNDLVREYGASISYTTSLNTLTVRGKAPTKHLLEVLDIALEGLYVPKLSKKDFEQRVVRERAELENNISDPDNVAVEGFGNTLFPKGHLHHDVHDEEILKILPDISLTTIRAAHKKQIEGIAPHVAVAGDIPNTLATKISKLLKKYEVCKTRDLLPEDSLEMEPPRTFQKVYSIPDKQNASVLMGQRIQITPQDEDYYPLRVLFGMLGGGASAHLFSTIRERDGLTYGIYAQLYGINRTSYGAWMIEGSFAPENVSRAVAAIEKELTVFLKQGITKEVVDQKKKELMQKFWTGMQGVERILGAYYSNYLSGFTPEEFYTHPEKIEKVTLEDVQRVAKKYIDTKNITTIVAGSVDKKYAPLRKS